MKSLPFVNGTDCSAPCTREEAESLDAGLRLLAKFIASAIRRRREQQIADKNGGAQ